MGDTRGRRDWMMVGRYESFWSVQRGCADGTSEERKLKGVGSRLAQFYLENVH